MASVTADLYPPEFFRRADESNDGLFYTEARLVVHIDDQAIGAIKGYLRERLPPNAAVLDLMSSWRSHLPEDVSLSPVVGLGLNEVEMRENPQLHERVIHDLNADPRLPFPDASFDVALLTVSVQYITRPVEVFREAARVLKPGAAFHVFYSNRMFPTKAVAIWQALEMPQRAQLIATYFIAAGGWSTPETLDISPQPGLGPDPMWVVTARRL